MMSVYLAVSETQCIIYSLIIDLHNSQTSRKKLKINILTSNISEICVTNRLFKKPENG